MRIEQEVPMVVAIEGVLAGMIGAVAVTLIGTTGRKLLFGGERSDDAPAGAGVTAGEALADGPDMPPNMNHVTATFVQKVATGIFGTSLTPDQQFVAGTAWHLTYGGFWGMLYALLQSSVGVPKRVLGPVYGLALWVIGPGWLVPRMRLMLPPGDQRARVTALVLALHATYGVIIAFAFHRLNGKH